MFSLALKTVRTLGGKKMSYQNKSLKKQTFKQMRFNQTVILCDRLTNWVYLALMVLLPVVLPIMVHGVVLTALIAVGGISLLLNCYFKQKAEIKRLQYENMALKMQRKTGVEIDLINNQNYIQVKGQTYAEYLTEQHTKDQTMKKINRYLTKGILYLFLPLVLIMLLLQPNLTDYLGDIIICILALIGGLGYLAYNYLTEHK